MIIDISILAADLDPMDGHFYLFIDKNIALTINIDISL